MPLSRAFQPRYCQCSSSISFSPPETNLGLKGVDKGAADEFPLLLRICNPLETRIELLGCIHDPQVDTEMFLSGFSLDDCTLYVQKSAIWTKDLRSGL